MIDAGDDANAPGAPTCHTPDPVNVKSPSGIDNIHWMPSIFSDQGVPSSASESLTGFDTSKFVKCPVCDPKYVSG